MRAVAVKEINEVKVSLRENRKLALHYKYYIKTSSETLNNGLGNLQRIYINCALFNSNRSAAVKHRSDYIVNAAIKQIKTSYALQQQALVDNSLGPFEAQSFLSIDQALDNIDARQHMFCVAYEEINELSLGNIPWFYYPETTIEAGEIFINHEFKWSERGSN